MKCDNCPYPEDGRRCPCLEKTVQDIERLERRKKRKEAIKIDWYFKMAVGRSKRLRRKGNKNGYK